VVSLLAGYSYDDAAPVEVAIGGKTFRLLPYGSVAWAPNAKLDGQLVAAMRAGNTMVVQGTSSRGTATKDTYSLSGFTKAYRAINKACGLR
jgi:invasion protein IalB